MTYQSLLVERQGKHVAIVTLNRPHRMNAVNSVMLDELPRAWDEIERDPDIRVAVLTGAGERAFCSGMDVREHAPVVVSRIQSRLGLPISPLECRLTKPVICAVNGLCTGGGLVFVADCDLVICSENATFSDARVSVGQPAVNGLVRLARRIPLEAVLRMAFLGNAERMTARRAYDIGLVGDVVPLERLMERAMDLASCIAEGSPSAVRHTRIGIWHSLNFGLHEGLERGWEYMHRHNNVHPDTKEGPRAFAEKRGPRWDPSGDVSWP